MKECRLLIKISSCEYSKCFSYFSDDNVGIWLWNVSAEPNKYAYGLAELTLQAHASLPEDQDNLSPSLQYFRNGIQSRNQRILKLSNACGLFSTRENLSKMHLGDVIMYMVLAGKGSCKFFQTLFGEHYGQDPYYVNYKHLSLIATYLTMDEPGHCSYPDQSKWKARRSTVEYGFADGYPRAFEAEEARSLQYWCLENNLFHDGRLLIRLLELIHKIRTQFRNNDLDEVDA